jgi:hypothetical protein
MWSRRRTVSSGWRGSRESKPRVLSTGPQCGSTSRRTMSLRRAGGWIPGLSSLLPAVRLGHSPVGGRVRATPVASAREALTLLDQARYWTTDSRRTEQGDSPFFNQLHERFARAELLYELGRYEEAAWTSSEHGAHGVMARTGSASGKSARCPSPRSFPPGFSLPQYHLQHLRDTTTAAKSNGPSRIRTWDLRIMSPLL